MELKDNIVQIDSDGGCRCGKYESKGQDKIIVFFQIMLFLYNDCYKSKFCVRLFFFVVKSDLLLNLMLIIILVFLELIVIVLMNVVCLNENVVFSDCLKLGQLMIICRQSWFMLLEFVFLVEFQEKKSVISEGGINV